MMKSFQTKIFTVVLYSIKIAFFLSRRPILTRKIIHLDMDCFYASIEMRNNPALLGRPVAVGGRAGERGVLSTCNYEARRFGLHSAMPTAIALKRCPTLILLPVNMPLYREVSQQIQQIFHQYTNLVEPLSLDEAYLDVTDCPQCFGSATWIAEEIRQKIYQQTLLTASAGVAPLKFLAKIASDLPKPNGLFVIKPEEVSDFIQNLPLKKIPSVGRVTNEKLQQLGLVTCGDVQKTSLPFLTQHFGKLGTRIWQFSHAIDERSVQPYREAKSLAVEMTLHQDIADFEEAQQVLTHLVIKLKKRINEKYPQFTLNQFQQLGVKLKFHDFQQTTMEKSGQIFSTQNFNRLLASIWKRRLGRRVRLIGIHVQLPKENQQPFSGQLSLWE